MSLATEPNATGIATPATVATVAVRALCEFAAKAGDLDLRFTPAPTAQQGREGHQLVAQRRGPGHESEVNLSGSYQGLQVQEVFGDYDFRPYDIRKTPRLILSAQKKINAPKDKEKRLYSDGRRTDALT